MKPESTYIDGGTIHPRTGRKLSDSAETKKIDFLECPYAVVAYLKKLGLKESNVKIVYMEQPAIVSAFLSGQGDVAQTWAPLITIWKRRG